MFSLRAAEALNLYKINFKKYYKSVHCVFYNNSKDSIYNSIDYFDYILDNIDVSIGPTSRPYCINNLISIYIKFIPKIVHHEIFLSMLNSPELNKALYLKNINFKFSRLIIRLIGNILYRDGSYTINDPYVYSTIMLLK